MAALFLPDSGVLTFAVGRRRRGFRMAYYAAGHGRRREWPMAGKSRSGDRDDGVTVSFGAKFARSDQFKAVFRGGKGRGGGRAPYPRAQPLAGPLTRADRAERQAPGAGDPARSDARPRDGFVRRGTRPPAQDAAFALAGRLRQGSGVGFLA